MKLSEVGVEQNDGEAAGVAMPFYAGSLAQPSEMIIYLIQSSTAQAQASEVKARQEWHTYRSLHYARTVLVKLYCCTRTVMAKLAQLGLSWLYQAISWSYRRNKNKYSMSSYCLPGGANLGVELMASAWHAVWAFIIS